MNSNLKKLAHRLQGGAQERDLLLMRYSESNFLMPHIKRLIETMSIEVVVDVGANTGQTITELRHMGFDGKIVSFEPTPHLFSGLQDQFGKDPKWSGHQLALGREPGEMVLHRYQEESMNSFLLPSQLGIDRFRTLAADPIGEVTVPVERLDSVWADLIPSGRTFLKVDTQGFDMEVLNGATGCLDSVVAVLTEVPINQIYEGMPSVLDVLSFMDEHGFQLSGLFPVKRTKDKVRLVEADCMFVRTAEFA